MDSSAKIKAIQRVGNVVLLALEFPSDDAAKELMNMWAKSSKDERADLDTAEKTMH